MTNAHVLTWAIAALATAGVILRPWRLPEVIWAACGAVALVALGLLPWRLALGAVAEGTDVYLFLAGMMLLSELARREGLFDHLAARAARLAGGSAPRLFALVYGVGVVVTVFLSNDATAVVLTPAVYAVARAAGAQPLPYLLICAFVANAASFVLPISNPANLVIYGSQLPPLLPWLRLFLIPSVLAILVTYAVLRWTQRAALRGAVAADVAVPPLSMAGRLAAAGITVTALVLLGASAAGLDLGAPTLVAALLTAAAVLAPTRQPPWPVLRGVAWPVLGLVAGLFVLVAGLRQSGAVAALADVLRHVAAASPDGAAWGVGVVVAIACNLLNNLPAGLIAGGVMQAAQAPDVVRGAVLLGIDIGPNLSVTGSLATILWLAALRREGEHVDAWSFLKLGALVMPPALLAALAGVVLAG